MIYQKNISTFYGHYSIVHFLLEKGANVNIKDKLNRIPLSLGCINDENKDSMLIIKELIDNKSNIDK